MERTMDRMMLRLIIFIILATIIVTILIFTINTIKHRATSIQESNEWELFKKKFKKEYKFFENGILLAWKQNIQIIQKHNLDYDMGKKSFRMGVNQFTGLTHDEFKYRDSCCKKIVECKNSSTPKVIKPDPISTCRALLDFDLPIEIDWRTKGYVTPVKDQGVCGSCWAFSATGSLEGQHFRSTGKLLSFSEQQLMDCTLHYGNKGCEGGTVNKAFKYIKDSGIESEQSYTYEAKVNKCRYDKTKVVGRCIGIVDIKEGDEQELQKTVASVGPISVAINAGHPSFQHYSSGIYDEPECSSSNLDHAVLLVGYGEENGKKYWLVKNSWGPLWGLKGYIKMSRGKNNQCGIATQASYPLV